MHIAVAYSREMVFTVIIVCINTVYFLMMSVLRLITAISVRTSASIAIIVIAAIPVAPPIVIWAVVTVVPAGAIIMAVIAMPMVGIIIGIVTMIIGPVITVMALIAIPVIAVVVIAVTRIIIRRTAEPNICIIIIPPLVPISARNHHYRSMIIIGIIINRAMLPRPPPNIHIKSRRAECKTDSRPIWIIIANAVCNVFWTI